MKMGTVKYIREQIKERIEWGKHWVYMSVCRGGMRGPGVHCECVKKSCVLCCAVGARVR